MKKKSLVTNLNMSIEASVHVDSLISFLHHRLNVPVSTQIRTNGIFYDLSAIYYSGQSECDEGGGETVSCV